MGALWLTWNFGKHELYLFEHLIEFMHIGFFMLNLKNKSSVEVLSTKNWLSQLFHAYSKLFGQTFVFDLINLHRQKSLIAKSTLFAFHQKDTHIRTWIEKSKVLLCSIYALDVYSRSDSIFACTSGLLSSVILVYFLTWFASLMKYESTFKCFHYHHTIPRKNNCSNLRYVNAA